MSVHVFASFITPRGTASNNRGLTEGNTTTLQKLVWNGQVHTTVSAESIRFALRRRLAEKENVNRRYDDSTRTNEWKEPDFRRWADGAKETPFIDDDLLGFMSAKGAEQEGGKGDAKVRRAVLEITRAVSLTPWPGDVTFNAASPGATPSAQKKGSNPVPYATEMHATRYQYGLSLTPAALRVPARAEVALQALCALGEVAGNHARFLFDFSPESVVFRVADEAAPRILYCFAERAGHVTIPDVVRKVKAGDIDARELVIGGSVTDALDDETKGILQGATILAGVKAACAQACKLMHERVGKEKAS